MSQDLRFIPDPAAELTFEWVLRQFNKVQYAMRIQGWDDLRFPTNALSTGGTAPTVSTVTGLYEFTVGDSVFAHAQLPHSWAEGSVLKPHVHWMKTTSAVGNVNWQLDYRWARIGEVVEVSNTTIANETPAVSDADTTNMHAITELGDMQPANSEQVSDMLIMKLTRVAAVGTEYGARAALLEYDIHYQIDAHGSEQEFIK
jgi:hypothetical protein